MLTLPQYTFPKTQDERIHDDVCRQITWQSDIQSQEIHVEVKDSKVILSGRVETCLEQVEAENAAKAAFGVAGVANNIVVAPKRPRSDSEIADDIVAALRTCTSVVEELPDVLVRDGVAILRGRSRWEFQRQGAERLALAIVGVKKVSNLMVVEQGMENLRDIQKPVNLYRPHLLMSLRAS
jgi:osmotically-inducible protein OsmY